MQSNAIRSMWLNSLWESLHDKLAFTTLPPHVMTTCGFPSRAARGAEERRRPAEILVSEWRGNPEEHGMLSVHPERLSSEVEAAKAMIWAAGTAMHGGRGSRKFGIIKEGGALYYTDNAVGRTTAATVRGILADLGEMPTGKGSMPTTKEKKQTTRNRLWTCPAHPTLRIRIASDTVGRELKHEPETGGSCGQRLVITEPTPQKDKE